MALPELVKLGVERKLSHYCREKIPAQFLHQVQIGFRFRGNSVTLYERRPHYDEPGEWGETVIAQCRFDSATALWTLYWADRNSRWHCYSDLQPSRNFEDLLREIDKDPTCIFWG